MATPVYVWAIGGLAAWMLVDPDRFRGSSRVGSPPMKRGTTRLLAAATLAALVYSQHKTPAALPPPSTGP